VFEQLSSAYGADPADFVWTAWFCPVAKALRCVLAIHGATCAAHYNCCWFIA